MASPEKAATEVPDDAYAIPFGQAQVVRPDKDATIVTLSMIVHRSMKAAEQLARMESTSRSLTCARLSHSTPPARLPVWPSTGGYAVAASDASRLPRRCWSTNNWVRLPKSSIGFMQCADRGSTSDPRR